MKKFEDENEVLIYKKRDELAELLKEEGHSFVIAFGKNDQISLEMHGDSSVLSVIAIDVGYQLGRQRSIRNEESQKEQEILQKYTKEK